MLVSTSAATRVEVLSFPSAVLRRRQRARPFASSLALASPVELPEPVLWRQDVFLHTRRDDRDRFTRRNELDFIAHLDVVSIDEALWQGDLEFAGDSGHAGKSSNASRNQSRKNP